MKRLLLAEDDPELGLLLKSILENDGWQVSYFPDGRQAYKAAVSQDFDLAILDWRLPGMDGDTILGYFKSHKSNTPVIMLTGSDLHRVDELQQQGADAVLLKPCDAPTLLETVRMVMDRTTASGC